jgi:hypothetical protein
VSLQQSPAKSEQHPAYFYSACSQSFHEVTLDQSQIAADAEVMLDLTRGTDCDRDKSREIDSGLSSSAFGDIRRNRHHGTHQLRSQPWNGA